MNKFLMCIATLGFLLSGVTCLAGGIPLDLSYHGVTVKPRILPFSQEVRPEQAQSLAPDAKEKIIIFPAAQFRTPDGSTGAIGIRPKKGGAEVRFNLQFN